MTIADAPYIREAELFGEPPYDDDFPISSIESEFSRAKYYIGLAVDHLVRAANEAEHWEKDRPIDDLIEKLDDDFKYEMGQVLDKLRKEG